VTFDFDLEHILDACSPGDHRVQVWWRLPFAHSPPEEVICAKCLQTDIPTDDRQTDGQRTPRDRSSSWNELKIPPEIWECVFGLD